MKEWDNLVIIIITVYILNHSRRKIPSDMKKVYTLLLNLKRHTDVGNWNVNLNVSKINKFGQIQNSPTPASSASELSANNIFKKIC